jgi:protein SCO1/2
MRQQWLAAALVLLVGLPVRAEEKAPADVPDVGIDQRLGAQVPLDLPFLDESGRAVRLGDCLAGRPAILVLAYYRCPMLCTEVLNGLLDSLRKLPFDVGDRFNVVTVSFDPREKPPLAAAKKAHYLSEYGRPGADAGWHFLTGESASIEALTAAVGFRYRFDDTHDRYAHASGIMILTPEGKVARYFYGIDYAPKDLRLGLVESSAGKIGTPVDQVLLLCYHYDPAAGKYTAAVMSLVRIGGAITLGALVALLGRAWWRERRKAALPRPAAT